MAALLACGPTAALSHRTSLHLWQIRHRVGAVEVIIPGGRASAGVRWRRAPLPPGDVVERHGMRVTTPARTLVDVAGTTSRRDLARLVEEAQRRHLVTPGELAVAVARARGRTGIGRLGAGLPRPLTNVNVAGYEVDFAWPEQRLIIEVDGYEFHRSREAFERDRARDAALLAAGHRVLRVTWRQLITEPQQLVATFSSALAPIGS